jgi:hypothetical protein
MTHKAALVFLLAVWFCAWSSATRAADSSAVQFNRDIRPILTDYCFHCHGPDSQTRKKGLRLDREDGLYGKTEAGVVITRGKPADSELYTRIISDDEDEVMPPKKSKKKLTAAEKDVVKRWIEQGAPWQPHWSLVAPTRPELPAVKNAAWVRNPIDRFVLAKLEAANLPPAPEADKRTLARRAAFDIIGLPPDPKDVDAFLADSSPDAYEKFIDRLFASPHYGEHRARYWLDAARYADTHGLHFDNYREMWPYRDWVIAAFNRNMPFDQFSIEQIAGDLLPDRTLDDQVASGFVRCGMTTNEGGTIPEENLVMYARDRTETAARVWLGLTMNCCVCHDHKFDPITQRDFYSMSAFFNNNTMDALDGNIKDTPPAVIVPKPEDREKFLALTHDRAGLTKQLESRRAIARPDFDRWLPDAKPETIAAALPSTGMRLHAALSEGEGKAISCDIDGQSRQIALSETAQWQTGHVAPKALQAEKFAPAEFTDAGDFDGDQSFTCSVWAKLPAANVSGAIVARMDDSNNYRGWDLWVEGNRVGTHIIQHWEDDALKVVSDKTIDLTKWHHFAISYNGSHKAAGVRIYVDGVLQQNRVLNDRLKGTIRAKVPLKIGQRSNSSLINGLLTQDLRLYERGLTNVEVKQLATSTRLSSLLAKVAGKRTDAENKELYDWFMINLDTPTIELTKKASDVDAQLDQIKSRGAETLVMQEKSTAPSAFVLYRGEYDKRRDPVTGGTPAVLPALPPGAPKSRLGLAQWLFSPGHPLTARVTVNRFWQEVFGTGIVKTSDDFGVTGEAPSHPELLDWLAVDFRENNWDVRRTLKLIVTSAAYRQAATATPEKLERDPANRLVSRGPRFRMDAEMVRDTALASSGLMVEKIGGPSVRPYQPDGVWEAVAMPESNTRNYKRDTGESLYRRSMYTFWKRAAPPASMDVFNAPSREYCTVRRERTDTPLQALATMNDIQFVEAARHLAQLALEQGGDAFDSRLNFITQRLISRPFKDPECQVARSALADLMQHYKEHPEEAKQLLTVGESKRDESLDPATHAAWTMLTNQLMNLDETLNK